MNIYNKTSQWVLACNIVIWVGTFSVALSKGETLEAYCAAGAILNGLMAYFFFARIQTLPQQSKQKEFLRWITFSETSREGFNQRLDAIITANASDTLVTISYSTTQLATGELLYSAMLVYRIYKDDTHEAMGDQILATVKPSAEEGGIA